MKILIAPLHWGLGHAARSAALIDILLDASIQCSVASDGAALEFLRLHFEDRLDHYIELPPYPVVYDEKMVALSVLKRAPGFLHAIAQERRILLDRQATENWDLIISDNRFGLRIPGVPCVFLSHQLKLKTGARWIDPLASLLNRYLARKFDQYWVPDFEGGQLTGELGRWKRNKSLAYIGPLHKRDNRADHLFDFHQVIVLSGPEPLRKQWEKQLLNQLEIVEESTLFVRGIPKDMALPILQNNLVHIENFMTKGALNAAITAAEVFIGRAGYSTIMDLCHLRKRAVLIPTPGQTEQEYLAKHLRDQLPIAFFREKEFNLEKVRPALAKLEARTYPAIDSSRQAEKILGLIQSLCG